jgi:hypothetical protein
VSPAEVGGSGMIDYVNMAMMDSDTRNMLIMIELLVMEMGEAAKKAAEHPQLSKQFLRDMVEFNEKLKSYNTKENNNG